MPLFGREFIAVPDDRKDQIVFKWPDDNLRRFSRAIVDADELALFLSKGQVIGTLEPGQHAVDADELPFLGAFIDRLSGGNAYRAELFFVGTREYTGTRFGGRIDDVRDPQTGTIVTLRVFGDYSLKVTDPVKLVTVLTGTVDVTDNDRVTQWLSDQLLKVMRTDVTKQIVTNGWPVLGLSAYTPEVEQSVVAATNGVLADYGLTIVRMGNFDINLAEEDEAILKRLSKDVAYSQMAGGFQQYAAGEAMLGAGEGMAKGGAATGGAFLATGIGVGQQAMAQTGGAGAPPPAQPAPPPAAPPVPAATAPAPPATTCPKCQADVPAGAHFCPGCGATLAPPSCPSCGATAPASAHFCPACGARMDGQA
ncbi:MAG TPA: SPFH domain-containing protein [Acidimicrobiales bacterium]|nr:SPFH domain-containing protein [Acidimicrobiales bacterium]